MKIPSDEFCRSLFEQYAVPAPIRRHLAKVEDVGTFLATQLVNAGVDIDVPLVAVGCRLHDAFKAASLEALVPRPEWGYVPTARELEVWKELRSRFAGLHETIVAATVLREASYPEFADFVAQIGSTGNPTYLTERIELQLLHYADWRVQFDTIISFDDRLAYLREAYKTKWIDRGESWWEDILHEEKELERRLFERLPFAPDDLAAAMEAAVAAGDHTSRA